MKTILFSLLFILCFTSESISQKCSHSFSNRSVNNSTDTRSDSLDIIHTDLQLDFTDFATQNLLAAAAIDFKAKVDGIESVRLDLLGLVVSEVLLNSEPIAFSQIGESIQIELGTTFNENETFQLEISYSGTPQSEAWGGFYWNSNFAYNMGVGFETDPHNFGRAWFPCFDNFTERCTFSFEVKTTFPKRVVANGILTNEETFGDTLTVADWDLEMEIPSYLASIAVAEFELNTTNYETEDGIDIPVILASPETFSSAISASFVNLPSALQSFEENYGPYEWPRVGYTFVPFNSGAMEHATNIAYPITFADGSLTFETLMAHELAHHWWGNLVTCTTAEDMWINEGMASFSEGLFLEGEYGADAYYDWVTSNHKDVITTAHLNDGSYLPISGIGHENTYGTHVYSKGASAGHSLRTYMGAEQFSEASRAFMDAYYLQDVSSEDMRDFFQDYTMADLSAFFHNWIFNPGFVDFSIVTRNITELSPSEFSVELTVEQRLRHAPEYYSQMPVQVTLISENGEEYEDEIMVSDYQTMEEIICPFSPEHIILNRNYGLTPAILAEERTLTDDGIETFSYAEFRTDVENLGNTDSLWLRVECHLTGPHDIQPQEEFHISTDRFWRVMGNINEEADIEGRLNFNSNSSSPSGFDLTFFEQMESLGFTEENIVLVHRPKHSELWSEHSSYEINELGPGSDFNGRIEFLNLEEGDYTWAYHSGPNLVKETEFSFNLYPNPAKTVINIENLPEGRFSFEICDATGKSVKSVELNSENFQIDISDLCLGSYVIRTLGSNEKSAASFKFIKE